MISSAKILNRSVGAPVNLAFHEKKRDNSAVGDYRRISRPNMEQL